jgi:hypothetical protein
MRLLRLGGGEVAADDAPMRQFRVSLQAKSPETLLRSGLFSIG